MIASVVFLLAVAAAVAFWPSPAPRRPVFSVTPSTPAAPAVQPHPTCREALELVVEIRERLAATDTLDDKAKAAIETLALCLINGSDQP